MAFLTNLFSLLASAFGCATAVVTLLCILIEKNRQHTDKEHEKSEPPPKAG